jgi:soluble lytic murein transglycosylase
MSQRVLGTWLVLGAVLLCGALALVVLGEADRDRSLPLADTRIIRAQAAEKRLDPALIAAVIYCESKFEPRPSSAGAEGLMQILPQTAYYLAKLSGGRTFNSSDLATPSVNVAYGSYYLRYLLDHYGGNEVLALAAYNGGLANVDRWVAHADAAGRELTIEEIPFPETREYVRRVLDAEQVYRSDYARELGLA